MKKSLSLIMAFFLIITCCSCAFISPLKRNAFLDESIEITINEKRNVDYSDLLEASGGKEITWESSNETIVTAEDGTIKAVGLGTADVTAFCENGLKKVYKVTVIGPEITSVKLNKVSANIGVGESFILTVSCTPADADKGVVEWFSDDKTIATVNSEGLVTGVKKGIVNINCKVQNTLTASCTVTVNATTTKVTENENFDEEIDVGYVNSNQGFVFTESSTRKLTKSEVSIRLASYDGSSPTGNYAQDAINEIYARHGYKFNNKKILNFYKACDWYSPSSSFSESDFSAIEKYNIALFTKYK